jgi:ABC-type sulfate transport system permease subunit
VFAPVLTAVPLELAVGLGSVPSAAVFGYTITAAPTRADFSGRSV